MPLAVLLLPALLAAAAVVAADEPWPAAPPPLPPEIAADPEVPPFADTAYAAELVAAARARRLWEDRYWRLLVHYRKGLRGTYSDAAWSGFFLAPDGRTNPRAEIEATLQAFFEAPAEPDRHAQCRFPARYAWLRDELGFDARRLPPQACPRYEAWREMLEVDSVSLVFASSYLNNPSSMYGHTFLLLHKTGNPDWLLDTSVNFAAEPTTRNGMLYMVYGLIGVFPGRFSALPYYMKVQQYNNLESRDLWEYRLDLDEAARERLLRHIWEMDGVHFPYYFFNKNCSYQLLPMLEVADPRLRLTDRWPLFVIPADTLRAVIRQPGLVKERTYRPSHITRMVAGRRRLVAGELDALRALVRPEASFDGLETLPLESRARVLDSASEYLEYRLGYRRNPPETLAELQRRVHIVRGRLGVDSIDPPTVAGAPPESGHESSRLSLSYGSDGDPFASFTVRLSLHDLLDRTTGYHPSSTLEMGHLELRLRDDRGRREAYLHGFDLVRIISLSPRDRWTRAKSWKMSLGLETATELAPRPGDGLHARLNVGAGQSFETRLLGRELYYAMLELDAGVGSIFDGDTRWGGGMTVGALLEPTRWWRMRAEATQMEYVLGDRRGSRRISVEQGLSPFKNVGLRLRWARRGAHTERSIALQKYF